MSDIRYFTDEHVSKAVVRALRRRDIDVLTVAEAQRLGASDQNIMAFALSEGRIIFTQDDDFIRLAADGHPHAGIVYAQQGTSIRQIIQGLTLISQVLSAAEMAGQIEFL